MDKKWPWHRLCIYYVSNTNSSYKIKVNSLCSVYTAEGFAIQAALERISENNMGNSVIVSDSKSVSQSIKGHSGIPRNEIVDQVAK